jgi:hypothetical protein
LISERREKDFGKSSVNQAAQNLIPASQNFIQTAPNKIPVLPNQIFKLQKQRLTSKILLFNPLVFEVL